MFIVDRFAGDMVVIEYPGGTFDLPRDLLPAEAVEGDVLCISIVIDEGETETREARIEHLVDDIFED